MLDDLAHSGRVFTESFESRERLLGSGSAAVLTSLQNMAALFLRQQDHHNAEPYIKGAEQISAFLMQAFGPVYPENYEEDLLKRFPRKIHKRRISGVGRMSGLRQVAGLGARNP